VPGGPSGSPSRVRLEFRPGPFATATDRVSCCFLNTDVAFFSITGNDGYFKRSNSAFERMLGWAERELLAKSFYALIHPDDIPLALSKLVEVERTGRDVAFDTRFMHKDGRYRWLAWVVQGAELSDARYATARDITEQHEMHEALVEVQERLRLAMSMSEAGSWGYDLVADHLTLDDSAEAVMNIAPGEFGGRLVDLLALAPAEDHERINRLRAASAGSEPIETDFRIVAGDGSTRYVALRGKIIVIVIVIVIVIDVDRRGRPVRAVGIAWNVTGQKQMEQQLLDLVMNDQLTGLKNRRSFDQTIRNEWRRSHASGQPLAVIMLDIDDFKRVNDTFGHQVGDRYLTSVARALTGVATRPGDVVARYGGEEFIALLTQCGPDQARAVADRFVAAVRALELGHPDGEGWLTVSVGVSSVRPTPDLSLTDIIRAADNALYQAKANGKNGSHFLDMQKSVPARVRPEVQ
jgi:diguanylate cyclase (GGDEF)-like protein/PAS domain S-box-containing protein